MVRSENVISAYSNLLIELWAIESLTQDSYEFFVILNTKVDELCHFLTESVLRQSYC